MGEECRPRASAGIAGLCATDVLLASAPRIRIVGLAGCRRLSADAVADILATGDKTRCGPLAPACGLTFVGVDYA